jgi:phage terminase large subunit-like protein
MVENGADPFSEELLRAVNPGYGVTVSAEYLRDKAEKARTTPSFYPTYLRLHANVRAKSTAGLIRMADWNHQDQVQMVIPEQLKGRVCFGGMDLSSTTDLTAVVLLFPRGDETFDVLPRFWLPEGNLSSLERHCRVPYGDWARQGYLHTTEGPVVEYQPVREYLMQARKAYQLKWVGYDPWNATETVTELDRAGINMEPVRQTYQSISSPTKLLQRLVLQHQVVHGGHPVLRWNADCLMVRQDELGNLRPVKPDLAKSSKRIDGMIALIMALSGWQRYGRPRRSAYEDHGLQTA